MISVILPIYNVEEQLSRGIESILNQTYMDFELLLINDGSTDSSLQICKDYARKDSRVVVIDQVNQGVSAARNTGIENAKGNWIAFVDPDDYIHPNYLRRLVNVVNETGAEIAVCHYHIVHEEYDAFTQIAETEPVVMTGFESLKNFFGSDYTRNICPWGKLVKKELHEGLVYPVGRVQEDAHITYKLFARAKKVSYIDEYLYHYYQRKNSIMNHPAEDKFLSRRNDALHAQDEMIEFFRDEMYHVYYGKVIALKTYTLANACYQLKAIYKDSLEFKKYYALYKAFYKERKNEVVASAKEKCRYFLYNLSEVFFSVWGY